jgi:hypothetical protein
MKGEVIPIVKDKEVVIDLLKTISMASMENLLIPLAENAFSNFKEKNQDVIKTFLYWQDKIEEMEYRTKPHFTLTMVKNRDSAPSIVAKVKWIYKYKGKVGKTRYLSVYIGSSSKYPKGLKDAQLFYDAPKKVNEYLLKECPLELDL